MRTGTPTKAARPAELKRPYVTWDPNGLGFGAKPSLPRVQRDPPAKIRTCAIPPLSISHSVSRLNDDPQEFALGSS